MQTKIFLDSPAAILGQAQTLGFSEAQKLKLSEIQKQSRQKALAVLTLEQRKKLGDIPTEPVNMASLCQKMCSTCCAMMQSAAKGTGQQIFCPVMGGRINKNMFTIYNGKKVCFCCGGCKPTFEKNPEKYISKLPQFKN